MRLYGEPSAVVLVIEGRIDGSEVCGWCSRLQSLIDQSQADLVAFDVAALRGCDFVAIDVLARLGLTARRLGCAPELRGASDPLAELIAFAGLQEILPVRD